MRCQKSYYNENKDGLEELIKKAQYCLENQIFYIPFKQIEKFWMLDDDDDDDDDDVDMNSDTRNCQDYLVYRNKYHGPWCHWYGNYLDYIAQSKVKINLVTKNDKEKKVERYELCNLD